MNTTAIRDLDKFLDDLMPVEQGYRFLSLRYFALKVGDQWQVVMANLQIEAFPEVQEVEHRYQQGRVAAGVIRRRGTMDELKSVLEVLRSKRDLKLHGVELHLPDGDGRGTFGSYYRPFATYPLPQGIRTPSVRLFGSRPQGYAYDVAQLDIELKASNVPYHTVAELLAEFGLPTQLPEQPYVELFATAVAEFVMTPDGCKVEKEAASFSILLSRELEPGNLLLGWRWLQDSVVQGRASVDGLKMQWAKTKAPYLKGTFSCPVPERSVVQAFLSYRGALQQEWWFADSEVIYNSRRAAHEAFDPKLIVLEKLLFDPAFLKMQDSRRFEEGVTYLLSLLGFRATHYGKPLDNAPDILASTVRGDIALVECTTGTIDASGKLGKLAGRTEAVKARLTASAHQSTRVLPVMVTALPRAEVMTDLTEAEKLGITVLTAEDLRGALPRTLFQGDPHLEIYEQAYAAVNSRSQRTPS